jgi:phage tail sheath protein FI
MAGNNASFMTRSSYAALFFPFVRAPDPASGGRITRFAPCGAVAGVFARIDAAHGVWKAPAGREATVAGVSGPTIKLSDRENGQLGAQGINGLRSFPNLGTVVWGARTLDGTGQPASEWAYVPVRRLALFIEESIDRGTRWAAFEPNDEALWARIRRNVEAFMDDLFRQGAFAGAKPEEAFYVRCDTATTSQNDIDLGIVTIVVGFAPLRPSEFVVIRIDQFAGKAVP